MSAPDNYSQWEVHEREQERRLARLPVCDECGNPIQDGYYYDIGGDVICSRCLDECFRKEIDE